MWWVRGGVEPLDAGGAGGERDGLVSAVVKFVLLWQVYTGSLNWGGQSKAVAVGSRVAQVASRAAAFVCSDFGYEGLSWAAGSRCTHGRAHRPLLFVPWNGALAPRDIPRSASPGPVWPSLGSRGP